MKPGTASVDLRAVYMCSSMWRSPHLSVRTGTFTDTPFTTSGRDRPDESDELTSIDASICVARHVQSRTLELPSSHNRLSGRTEILVASALWACAEMFSVVVMMQKTV